jgi:hypothetical protein
MLRRRSCLWSMESAAHGGGARLLVSRGRGSADTGGDERRRQIKDKPALWSFAIFFSQCGLFIADGGGGSGGVLVFALAWTGRCRRMSSGGVVMFSDDFDNHTASSNRPWW